MLVSTVSSQSLLATITFFSFPLILVVSGAFLVWGHFSGGNYSSEIVVTTLHPECNDEA